MSRTALLVSRPLLSDCVGLHLPGLSIFWALDVTALWVQSVGVLAPGIELVARGARRVAMGGGGLLQPDRLGGLGLGLGLGGARFGRGFVNRR